MKALALSFVLVTFTVPAFSYTIIERVVNGASTSRTCPLSEKTQAKHLTYNDYTHMSGGYDIKENKFNGDSSKTFYYKNANVIVRAAVLTYSDDEGGEKGTEQLQNDPEYFIVHGNEDCSEKFVDLAFGQSVVDRYINDHYSEPEYPGQDSDVSELNAKVLFNEFKLRAQETCNELNRSKSSQVEIFNKSKKNGWFSRADSKIKIHFEARCHIQE